MRNILIFSMICLMGVLSSCYYDNPPEPIPIDPSQVSFDTHIQPILQKSCATANCHDGTTMPDLREDVSYTNLLSGGYVNTTIPTASFLYKSVDFQEEPMPPGGPKLSELDIELILVWIQKGAPND